MTLITNEPVPVHIHTEMMMKKNKEIIALKQTLKDQFAMAALQGLLASCQPPATDNASIARFSERAYQYADECLKARSQTDE